MAHFRVVNWLIDSRRSQQVRSLALSSSQFVVERTSFVGEAGAVVSVTTMVPRESGPDGNPGLLVPTSGNKESVLRVRLDRLDCDENWQGKRAHVVLVEVTHLFPFVLLGHCEDRASGDNVLTGMKNAIALGTIACR